MTSEEKRAFVNEAEKAAFHPLVESAMKEFARNMGFEYAGLPKYGLSKIAQHAAVVSRAMALGIEVDELKATKDEYAEDMLKIAAKVSDKVQVIVVEGS